MTPFQPAFDVLTMGEAMVLFAARETGPLDRVASFDRTTAGAELNVAMGLARLGFKVAYLSRLGADAFGQHIVSVLDHEGINRDRVTTDPIHPTGFMLKSRTGDGSDPKIEYFRKGSAASHLSTTDLTGVSLTNTRHVHLTGISPALSAETRELVFELARQARTHGCTVSFDPNLRPRLWPSEAEMVECLNRLAALSDWVLPGLAEGQLLTGQTTPEGIARFYLAQGASAVVIKLGPEGAYCATAHTQGHVPGVPVERVVDTVGAGDGFAVGVVSGLLEGLDLPTAVARGNAIGARVVQFPGDADGLPTRTELHI